jgi:hypothetical protein
MKKYVFIIEKTIKHIRRKVKFTNPNYFTHLIYGDTKLRMVFFNGNVHVFISISSVGPKRFLDYRILI